MSNQITQTQWNQILTAVQLHAKKSHQHDDVIYSGKTQSPPKIRFYIYDNYDRVNSPGLDFVVNEGSDYGNLTVWCGTEQAYAPIDFETGLNIASNFFNCEGSMIAEEIVCDYVMDDNPKIMLWRQ